MVPSFPQEQFFWQKIFNKYRQMKSTRALPQIDAKRMERQRFLPQELKAPSRFTILLTSHQGKKNWRISLNYATAYFFLVLFVTIVIFSILGMVIYIRNSVERKKSVENATFWLTNQKLAWRSLAKVDQILTKMDGVGKEMYDFIWKEKAPLYFEENNSFLWGNFQQKTKVLLKALRFFHAREDAYQNMPRGMPLESAFVTSLYGHRVSPFGFEIHFHSGIDFANSIGTPVLATADGEVISAQGEGGGYGKHVRLLHKYGLVTLYAHLSELKVKKGQRVKKGDVIGLLGQSGSATGPHLHYEVRVRNPDLNNVMEITFNPWPFIKEL